MKLSGPDGLGVVNALLLALAFPLFWGARDFFVRRKLNLFAALGCSTSCSLAISACCKWIRNG